MLNREAQNALQGKLLMISKHTNGNIKYPHDEIFNLPTIWDNWSPTQTTSTNYESV